MKCRGFILFTLVSACLINIVSFYAGYSVGSKRVKSYNRGTLKMLGDIHVRTMVEVVAELSLEERLDKTAFIRLRDFLKLSDRGNTDIELLVLSLEEVQRLKLTNIDDIEKTIKSMDGELREGKMLEGKLVNK